HCKGAILEERLNFLESRKFRREHHNFKQMSALPVKWVESVTGKKLKTNEKLLIFKKWFEERIKDRPWRNLGKDGAKLEGIPSETFESWYEKNPSNITFVSQTRKSISENKKDGIDSRNVFLELKKVISELKEFRIQVGHGEAIS